MMDHWLSKLDDLTQDLLDNINKLGYEEIELFVDERQELCDKIKAEIAEQGRLNEIQKQTLSHILSADSVVVLKMQQLQNEASEWLERNNQIKRQMSAYQAVYTSDSYFVDKKN